MSLFNTNLQVNIPGIPLGVLANVNFVPLKIKVSVDSTEVGSPGGSLLDMLFGVNYRLDIGSSGLKLTPGLGKESQTLASTITQDQLFFRILR